MDERIHDLIAKDLAGESTPAESAEVQAWAQASPEHRRYVDDLSWVWQQAAQGRPEVDFVVDTEKALGKVHAAMNAAPVRQPSVGKIFPFRPWLRVAAAVATLAVAAIWLLHPREYGTSQQIVSTDQPRRDTLQDGSVVVLNRQTELVVSNRFNHRERRMRLRGEAQFSVQPDPQKPFVVEVEALEVRAVGTAFNVDDFTQAGKVVVTVTEGKVQMQTEKDQLLLLAGQAGVYDKADKTLRRLEKPNPNVLAYQNRVFHFEHNTSLAEIVAQLNAVYPVQIVLQSPELEKCRINDITFPNKTLEQILETLKETFNFTYRKEGDTYVLEGSCDY